MQTSIFVACVSLPLDVSFYLKYVDLQFRKRQFVLVSIAAPFTLFFFSNKWLVHENGLSTCLHTLHQKIANMVTPAVFLFI